MQSPEKLAVRVGSVLPRALRLGLLALMLDVLVVPPSLWADSVVWNGGSGAYSTSANWACTGGCAGFTHPANGLPPLSVYDVTISSGGLDVVNLDTTATINKLALDSFPATLNIGSGTALTIGTSAAGGTVIGNGGILNISGSGAATLNLTNAGAHVTNNGGINVTAGGTLTLQGDANPAVGRFIDNSGTATVDGAASQLILSGNNLFTLGGSGIFNLTGGASISGTAGNPVLQNEFGHTLQGNGSIGPGLTNRGALLATGGASLIVAQALDYDAGQKSLSGPGLFSAGGGGANLQLNNIAAGLGIVSTAASIVLNADGHILNGAGADALAGFLTAANGYLTLAQGANLSLTPGAAGFTNNGTVQILSGATLDVSGTTFHNADGGVLTGNFAIGSGSQLIYSGAAITTISGTVTISDSGSITNTAGPSPESSLQSVTGVLNVDTGANMALTSLSGLQNSGQVNVSDASSLSVAGTLTNGSAAPGNIAVSGGSTLAVGGQLANLSDGTVTTYGGGNTLTAHGLSNAGVLAVQAGDTADFSGGTLRNLSLTGVLSGGTYRVGGSVSYDAAQGLISSIATNTNVTFDAQNVGAHALLSGSADALSALAGNAGSLTLLNGVSLNITPAGGTFTNTGSVNTSALNNAQNVLNVTGNIFNTAAGVVNLSQAGDMMTATGQFTNAATVNLNAAGASIQAGGTITNSGDLQFNATEASGAAGGDFVNAAGSVITIADGLHGALIAGARFQNAGDVAVGNTDTVTAETGATNAGHITLDNGASLAVHGGNTYSQTAGETTINAGGVLTAGTVLLQGGKLDGLGTIAGNLVNDAGVLAPADAASGGQGVFTITGHFAQHSQGLLDLDLASGTLFDALLIGGDVSLDGTLRIDLIGGFSPTVGQTFRILSWSGVLSGNFNTLLLPVFSGLTFSEVVNAHDISLSVVASAVPEPATFGLVFGVLVPGLGLSARARRRRNVR